MIHLPVSDFFYLNEHSRALKILQPIFEQNIVGEDGQGILASSKTWVQLLDMLPDDGLLYFVFKIA